MISIPLAAISVATSTLIFLSFKFLSAACLAHCDLFPWIAAVKIPAFISIWATLSAPCFVLVNTNALSIEVSFIKCTNKSFLSTFSTKYNSCFTVSTVEDTGETITFTGSLRIVCASSIICAGIVAEKKSDCLLFGNVLNIFLISLINPISNIRSASSSTNILIWAKLTCLWLIKSSNLPGVAITISTPLRNIFTCGDCHTHPKITVFVTHVCFPYESKLSPIWIANSLVGVKINAHIFHVGRVSFLYAWSNCKIGIANDAVFHVPVCAHPKTSFPSRINGIDFAWIGVGVVYHSVSKAFRIGEISLRSSNNID